MKTVNVMKECWDYLIVLDACRYDYFQDLYQQYFSGELERRISVGSGTPEWCKKSFPNYYRDIVYISGNPYINSKIEIAGFDSKNRFYKVVDVWEFGWCEELGTVLPEEINKTALKFISKLPKKRFIIHYMQPHAPYLSSRFRVSGFPIPDIEQREVLSGIKGYLTNRTVENITNVLLVLLFKVRLIKDVWKLRERINLHPASPMDAVRRKYGIDGLREAYKENLKIVLGYVSEICNELLDREPSRKIVITADHGEFLGERGLYSHGQGRDDPILTCIPWLKVSDVR